MHSLSRRVDRSPLSRRSLSRVRPHCKVLGFLYKGPPINPMNGKSAGASKGL